MHKRNGRLSNLIFVALFYGFLTILLFYIFLKPQNISSAIENRFLATRGQLFKSSFLDSSFQDTLNNIIADQFPKRESIVREKKNFDYKVQKHFRKFSIINNGLNNNDLILYPMEDGSRYQIGDSNYMCYGFMEEDQVIKDRIIERVDSINQLQKDYPDIKMYIYLPRQAHELNIFDEANKIENYGYQYGELIKEKSELKFKALEVNNIDEYKDMFYASDHHWNAKGSYQGYLDLLDLLEIKDEALKPTGEHCMSEWVPFYGTHGNATGRVLAGDHFCVLTYDYPEFEIYDVNNELVEDNKNPNYFAEHEYSETGYYYDDAYSTYSSFSTFKTNQEDKENILVVGDSYTGPIAELLASHFNTSYFYSPVNNDFTLNYDEFIQNHDIDKILFMFTIEDYFYEDDWGPRYKFFEITRGNR